MKFTFRIRKYDIKDGYFGEILENFKFEEEQEKKNTLTFKNEEEDESE